MHVGWVLAEAQMMAVAQEEVKGLGQDMGFRTQWKSRGWLLQGTGGQTRFGHCLQIPGYSYWVLVKQVLSGGGYSPGQTLEEEEEQQEEEVVESLGLGMEWGSGNCTKLPMGRCRPIFQFLMTLHTVC